MSGTTNTLIDPGWQESSVVIQQVVQQMMEQMHASKSETPDTQIQIALNAIDKVMRELAGKIDIISNSAQSQITNAMATVEHVAHASATIARTRERSVKQVVFVVDIATPRQAKLAYGLKQIGWEVILLHRDPSWFDVSSIFTKIHTYANSSEAVLLASLYSPLVYHVFSSWNFDTAEALIKSNPGKIVFDDYDVFAGCLKEPLNTRYQEQIKKEKFCLENSAGQCSRGLVTQVAKKTMNYKLPKRIFFPEYCWDDVTQYRKPRRAKLTDGIHAVYVGTIMTEYFYKPEGYINVFDSEFIEMLTQKKIHYHIYPYFGKVSKSEVTRLCHDFIEVAKRNPYFHFHDSVPVEELSYEISAYHFGLCCQSERVKKNGCWTYLHGTHYYGTHNKPFDYLDAGLVVVSYGWRVVERLLAGTGTLLLASREQCGDVMASYDPAKMESEFGDKIEKARRKLSVWRQAPRLAKFYHSIAE